MDLRARPRQKALISLVPMIDVLLILLVFFMVTSTYLDLNMVPASERADPPAAAASGDTGAPDVILARLGSDGGLRVRGQSLGPEAFGDYLRERLAEAPLTAVVLLPSGQATTQGLATAMDAATRAGVTRLRIVRLEARP